MSQPNHPNPTADEATALEIVQRLITYRILSSNPDTATYTTHPLIRDHYLNRLQQNRDRAVALHRQIADFYLTTAGNTPRFPTLADLTPLIEAVHHRCRAGDYDQAGEIVWERIYQRDRFVLLQQLGAYDTALTLMQDFSPEGDTTQTLQVSSPNNAQRWILNMIGACLMSLGRLAEAPPFYERSAAGYVSAEDWPNASGTYQNLADLYASLGDLSASATAAESALTYARRANNQQNDERTSLACLGWAAHLQGHLDAAQTAFQQAEHLQRQIAPDQPYLYSLSGIKHAEHLRRRGETDYARRITEANRIICKQNHWQADHSLCHRLLGDLDAAADNPQEAAQVHYNEALRLARSISRKDVLIAALLARGRWAAQQEEGAAAVSDLEEALGYAVEGGYRIYEADIRVALAWMHQTAGKLEVAKQEAVRAQRMSQSMGYYWGQHDAVEMLAALGIDGQ